jgi:hypothetical protein
LLNRETFATLTEIRQRLASHRLWYNQERVHSSLDYMTSEEYHQDWKDQNQERPDTQLENDAASPPGEPTTTNEDELTRWTKSGVQARSRSAVLISPPAASTSIGGSNSPQIAPKLTEYTVRVCTGDKTGAGTDSTIFVTIFGASGQLAEQRLNGLISGNAFERNQTDSVVLKDMPIIGAITGVTV